LGGEPPSARDPRGRLGWVILILGLAALGGILGVFRSLPHWVGFFASSIPILLFPGMVLVRVAFPVVAERKSLLERLALWFACGLACLVFIGFIGILFRLRLSSLVIILLFFNIALLVLLVVRGLSRRSTFAGAGAGGARRSTVVAIVLIVASVALSLVTLYTARDNDDWFYLAYIRDYLDNEPINSWDAMLGPGWPAPARTWYGAWWVTEAMLIKVAGADPIQAHQAFLPLLIFPFAVFSLFTLARRIFQSEKVAYLACFLQMLFYLTSAYPFDSAGWALFSRTPEDKSLAFLVPVMVSIALGHRLVSGDDLRGSRKGQYAAYFLVTAGACLVHPLAIAWCGIGLIPFALVEAVRRRDLAAIKPLILLVIPLVIFGAALYGASGEAMHVLEGWEPGPHLGKGKEALIEIYLPGGRFSFSAGDRVYTVSENIRIAHPLLVTRYPLALAGLVLTMVAAAKSRASSSARYLVTLTVSVLLVAFTPGIAGLTASVINERMLYRLSWLFPWGMTVAFFLVGLKMRLRWSWLVAVVLTLALCRGGPQNYFRSLGAGRQQGRSNAELLEVLQALAREPSPKGVVLASSIPSLMMPALVSGAYPAYVNPAYSTGGREARITSSKALREMLQSSPQDSEFMTELERLGCRYILIEMTRSLANALRRSDSGFQLIFKNRTYCLYKTPVKAGSELKT
jgi:hypothetical protein